MNKQLLSETALYTGSIKLPDPIKIDLESLKADILLYNTNNTLNDNFPFSKNLSILDTYIREFIYLKHSIKLISRNTFGDIYKPGEYSYPLIQTDPMNLQNSCDFVLLYGVNVKEGSCNIRIEYDNNRIKNNYIDVLLKTNHFIIFPSTLVYYLTPNNSEQLNFILTTLYELK
jgi:hypothetical protein